MNPYESQEKKALAYYYDKDYTLARQVFQSILDTANDSNTKDACKINIASCYASQGEISKAINMLDDFGQTTSSDVLYNKSMCEYQVANYTDCLKYIESMLNPILKQVLLEKVSDRNDYSELLQQPCLIEALNLKAAALYKMSGSTNESKQCLDIISLENLYDLDCVTLHNLALFNQLPQSDKIFDHLIALIEDKDYYLIATKQVIQNRLKFYLRNGEYDLAEKFFTKHRTTLEQDLDEFSFKHLELWVTSCRKPNDAYRKRIDTLLEQLLTNSPLEKDIDSINRTNRLESVQTIIADQCSYLWRSSQYKLLETVLLKAEPLYKKNIVPWKKSLAHTLFMLDTRYEECSQMYEDLLPKKETDSLLTVDPIILSNLCISYVLTGHNSEAEGLIKEVEAEELKLRETGIATGLSHLSIINLTIGTLYCVKSNYEFGLTRIIKTFEPVEEKLDGKMWFHAKRCILSFLDGHCKQLVVIKDDILDLIIEFLINCEKYGMLVQVHPDSRFDSRATVTYEARYLRAIALTIMHDS